MAEQNSRILALINQFPALADDIEEGARNGYSADEITQRIGEYTKQLRGEGQTPGEVYAELTGRDMAQEAAAAKHVPRTMAETVSGLTTRIVPALIGATAGAALGPPGMAAGLIGGALGAGVGEAGSQLLERGEINPASTIAATLLGAVPGVTGGGAIGRIGGAAGLGAGSAGIMAATEGEPITPQTLIIGALLGGGLGAGVHALEGGFRRAPRGAPGSLAAEARAAANPADDYSQLLAEAARQHEEGVIAQRLAETGAPDPRTTAELLTPRVITETAEEQALRLTRLGTQMGPEGPFVGATPEDLGFRPGPTQSSQPPAIPQSNTASDLAALAVAGQIDRPWPGIYKGPISEGRTQPVSFRQPRTIDLTETVKTLETEPIEAQIAREFAEAAKPPARGASTLEKSPRVWVVPEEPTAAAAAKPAADVPPPPKAARRVRITEPEAASVGDSPIQFRRVSVPDDHPAFLAEAKKLMGEGQQVFPVGSKGDLNALRISGAITADEASALLPHLQRRHTLLVYRPLVPPAVPTKEGRLVSSVYSAAPEELAALQGRLGEHYDIQAVVDPISAKPAGLEIRPNAAGQQALARSLEPLDPALNGRRLFKSVQEVQDYLDAPASKLEVLRRNDTSLVAPEAVAQDVAALRTPVDKSADVAHVAQDYLGGRTVRDPALQQWVVDVSHAPDAKALQGLLKTMPEGYGPMAAVAVRRRAQELGKLNVRMINNVPHLCLSPCQPIPGAQNLTLDQADKLATELQLYSEVQLPVEIQRRSLLGRIKSAAKDTRLVFSPSFVAEGAQSKPLQAIVDRVNQLDDLQHAWRARVLKRFDEAGLRKLELGTAEDVMVGRIMETPELRSNAAFMASQPEKVRKAVAFGESMMREWADALGLPAQSRLSDYFPHFFDRQTIRAEAMMLKAKYAEGTLPPELAKGAEAFVADLDRVIAAIDQGENMATLGLPNALGKRFLQHRVGASGYQMSFLKSFNSYLNFFEKRHFWSSNLEFFRNEMLSIEDQGLRAIGLSYLRDNFNRHTPRAQDAIGNLANTLRTLEFHRTIGFLNVGAALKNGGQSLFTVVEGGPLASKQGFQMVFDRLRNGKDTYIGRLLTDSGVLESVPTWVAPEMRTATSSLKERAIAASGFLFNSVEKGNRTLAFYTGMAKWFQGSEARKAGLTLEKALATEAIPREAIEFARQFVRKTQFKYGPADLPFVLRDPTIGAAFQYQSYTIKSAELLWKWAAREGMTGKAKLGALLGIGLGVAELGKLAGVDLSKVVGVPLDLLSAVNALEGMKDGDWVKVRASAKSFAVNTATQAKFGPIGGAVSSLYGTLQAYGEGKDVTRMISNFFTRDLIPSQAHKITLAYRNYVANPDAAAGANEFVGLVAGFPNAASRVRLAYLQALEDGKTKYAEALRQAYRQRYGNLPVDFVVAGRARAEAAREKLKKSMEEKRLTPKERLRRSLPGYLEQILL